MGCRDRSTPGSCVAPQHVNLAGNCIQTRAARPPTRRKEARKYPGGVPDKVAVVTGGGTGIGRASALALGRDGYAVVIAGRRKDELDETVKDAEQQGSRMIGVVADVGKPEDVLRLFDETQKAFGRLDLLFNNA